MISEKETAFLSRIIEENRLSMPEKMKNLYTVKKRYKFVYGGRGGAKTYSGSKILLYIANQSKKRILCTREIQNTIRESIHSELSGIIQKYNYSDVYEITQYSIINNKTKSDFIFTGLKDQGNKQSVKGIAGVDICLIEEAQAVSQGSLDVLIPTIRAQDSELWFFYNPRLPDDPVELLRNKIPLEDKLEINIGWEDNPFLSTEILRDIQISKAAYDKGLDDSYLHIWQGQPVSLSDRAVFKQKEIISAVNREISLEGAIEIGVDVARFGTDRTVYFKRKGMKIIDWKMYQGLNVVDNANYVMDFADRDKKIRIKVDDSGVGGGVTDMLKSQGYNVLPVNNGQQAKDPDKYNNAISEQWFELKNKINEISIPDIQDLKSELMMREWKLDNKGRRVIESKEEYKKKGFRSPDFADAFLLCYYEPGPILRTLQVLDRSFLSRL